MVADAAVKFEPLYLRLPEGRGERFCVFHPAVGAIRAAVLYVAPFAEEMNKARRIAARQARAFASAGCAVLLLDLKGCGDSPGDFGEASWADWVADVAAAARWLRERTAAPLWLWGVRAGCLLLSEATPRIDDCVGWLLWQPPVSGRGPAQQFLRLRLAAGLIGGDTKGAAATLRTDIEQQGEIEVAGYRLPRALLEGFEQSVLAAPSPGIAVHWLEISSASDDTLLPASKQRIEQWRTSGVCVEATVVPGPAFWQVTEIEDAPALLEASCTAVLGSTRK